MYKYNLCIFDIFIMLTFAFAFFKRQLFFLNKNTAQGAYKNIKKSIIFKTKIVEN